MISVDEARRRIIEPIVPVAIETIGLSDGHGRVLARDMAARVGHPAHSVSAMDGYAVLGADVETTPTVLTVVGRVPAGSVYEGWVEPGQAVRIFTGAPVPDGADTVVIQEKVTDRGDGSIEVLEATPGRHIRKAGQDFRPGEVLLPAGRRLTFRDLTLLAAMNVPWLPVRRRPRVALLATGDELAMPGDPIPSAGLFNSALFGLRALAERLGAEVQDLGIAADTPRSLASHLTGASGADLLVTMGGASVGEHDLVQAALVDQGMALDFWTIAMRPGKPLMVGRLGSTLVIGLPGNPVSALTCAVLFVVPALAALQGIDPDSLAPNGHQDKARLGCDLPGNDHRMDFLRARLAHDGEGRLAVAPFPVQDSAMLSVLARADCYLVRPPHAPPARVGDVVPILRFPSLEL